MRQICSKYLCLIACLAVLAACSSSSKKPVIVIDKNAKPAPIILTDLQKQSYQSALIDIQQKRLAEAEVTFLQLIKEQPKLTGAYVNMGVIKNLKGEKAEAETYFTQALNIDPNFVDALLQQALILQDKGEFFEAETSLRKAEAINPEHPLVNYNLGVLYELYLQDYSLAIQYYKRYVSLSQADDVETVKRWILLLERK